MRAGEKKTRTANIGSRNSQPFSWKAAVLFVLTASGLVWYFEHEKDRMQKKRIAEANKAVGRPKVGGSFQLVDHDGKPFTDADLEGRYSLVSHGTDASTCAVCDAQTPARTPVDTSTPLLPGLLRLYALPRYLPRGARQDGRHV